MQRNLRRPVLVTSGTGNTSSISSEDPAASAAMPSMSSFFRDGDICHDTNSIACDSNESTCQAECDHAKALSERNLSAVIDQGNVQLAANRVFRFRSVHKRDFNAIITTISVFFNLRFTNYARTETHVGVNVSGFNDGTSCLCFCSC
ncbi:hypothetical protein FI667_g9209, partial [Globisporangium splendens]